MTSLSRPATLSVAIALHEDADALTEAFNAFDTNGDGKIDWREVEAAFMKVNATGVDPQDIMQLMQRVDTNGDGVLCLEEFKRVQSLKLHLVAQELLLRQQRVQSPKVPVDTAPNAAAIECRPQQIPLVKSHSRGWMRRTGSWHCQ